VRCTHDDATAHVGSRRAPVADFPEIPESLKTKCENLIDVPQTDKLSVVLSVITKNYGQYQECSIKVDTWQQWYNEQKQIFDSVK
jgi:hypothetical protein